MVGARNLVKAAGVFSALSLLPLLWGCRLVRAGRPVPVGITTGPIPARPAPSEEEVERRVRARIEEEARREAERKAAEEMERLRREALELDVEAVADLLDKAKAAALEKDMTKLASSLGMLRSALGAVCSGSAPGATEVSLLRALRLLEGGDAEGAKFHLRVAMKASEELGEVGGVPIAQRLSTALSAVEGGKLEEAKKALQEAEAALRGHPLFLTLERFFEHLDGAAEAAGRGAWKVAEAELAEASDLLPELRKATSPPEKGKPEEEKAPQGEKPPAQPGTPSRETKLSPSQEA